MRLMAPAPLVTALVLGPLAVAADQESEKFHGTWTIVSTQRDGNKVEVPDTSTVIFEKDSYRIKEGDKVVEEGMFKVDASKAPNRIEVTATPRPDRGMKWHGVYELDGDTLRAVVGPADKGPTDETDRFRIRQPFVHRQTGEEVHQAMTPSGSPKEV